MDAGVEETALVFSVCKWVVGGLVCLVVASQSGSVCAQDVAAAEALFEEGRELLKAAEYDAACEKLTESLRLDRSAGTALNLARCEELRGRLATAWAQYLVAKRIARGQMRQAIIEEAGSKAKELEPRLSYLLIELEQPIHNLTVYLGDIALAGAAIGTRIPIDPGSHVVRVTAPAHQEFVQSIEVSGAKAQTIPLRVPHLLPLGVGAQPGAADGGSAVARRSSQPTLAYVFGGAGLVGLAGGGALWWWARELDQDASDLCGGRNTDCPAGTVSKSERANTTATLGLVSALVGAASVGVGAYFFLSQEGEPRPGQSAALRWSLTGSPSAAGVSLRGGF